MALGSLQGFFRNVFMQRENYADVFTPCVTYAHLYCLFPYAIFLIKVKSSNSIENYDQ